MPLLLPDGFEGHPLRKDFVLAARVAKAWPGAKEPGESDADGQRARPAGAGPARPASPDPTTLGPAHAGVAGRAAGCVTVSDDVLEVVLRLAAASSAPS